MWRGMCLNPISFYMTGVGWFSIFKFIDKPITCVLLFCGQWNAQMCNVLLTVSLSLCSIPHLDSSTPPLEVALYGRALMPYCHFELEPSDYLTTRQSGGGRAVEGRETHFDPSSTRVIEFHSCGVGIKVTKYVCCLQNCSILTLNAVWYFSPDGLRLSTQLSVGMSSTGHMKEDPCLQSYPRTLSASLLKGSWNLAESMRCVGTVDVHWCTCTCIRLSDEQYNLIFYWFTICVFFTDGIRVYSHCSRGSGVTVEVLNPLSIPELPSGWPHNWTCCSVGSSLHQLPLNPTGIH